MSWDYAMVMLMLGVFLGGIGKATLEMLGRHLIEKYTEEIPLVDLPADIVIQLRKSATG